ncbi:MAG TPA: tetratricopeptide repeat protein [Thermoleophilia bacterium]|nr:tetratricopeptide repeat protein [Thermoleophilia bacterium]
MARVGEAEGRRDMIELLGRASAAFEQKRWQSARNLYRDALELIELRSLDVGEMLPQTMYNIAITYYNEREYSEARNQLLRLQKTFPSYEPELVSDMLRKIP